jgi:two-component system, NtrC family, response regulator HydG
MTGSDPTPSPGRILVVDADPEGARFAVDVLAKWGGFAVGHLTDPAAALRSAEAEPWDLVITAVELPGMTGLELLERLRGAAPDLPVAVVTTHSTLDNAVTALRHHADEFLEKPLRPDRLIATAHKLIARGRAARQASREVVLAVGAHPQDVAVAAGGTLLAHRDAGDEVCVLTLSRGGGADRDPAIESAVLLGAVAHTEELADGRISEGEPTVGVIGKVVADLRPTLVYTHSVQDLHQDHRNASRAAVQAAAMVGRVYGFQSPLATVGFAPTRFVAIDAYLAQKVSAAGKFAAQAAGRDFLEPDLIEATARYWSRFGEGRFAEAFEVIRDGVSGPGSPRAAASGQAGWPDSRLAAAPPDG